MAQTTPPPIDPAPTPAPQRGDRATFSSRVDAFVTWLTAAVAQFNAVASNVYANAVDAYNSAVASANSAAASSASASAAALVAGAAPFNPATNYAQYASAVSLVNLRTYRRKTAGTSATDPANDATNWSPVVPNVTRIRMARDAGTNTSLVLGDNSKLVDVTSGTFTQALDAAATLGAGWFVYYTNSGTGEVTLDPNGAEQINGAATLLVQKGAILMITCDGVGFTAKLLAGATGYMKVSDQKASGTNGGACTSGFNTRTLNTTDLNTINGASLASNQVTLPAGTYDFSAVCAAGAEVNAAKLSVYNVTDSTYDVQGLSLTPSNASTSTSFSIPCAGRVTITAAKVFQLRLYCGTTVGVNRALGIAVSSGQAEVFSQIEIKKVA